MYKDMYKFIVKLWCMAALVAGVVSCSSEENYDATMQGMDKNSPDIYSILTQFAGKYYGTWWLGDLKIEDSSEVCFYVKDDGTQAIEAYDFPYKVIASALFPDERIVNICNSVILGKFLDDEEVLYVRILDEALKSNDRSVLEKFYCPMNFIGYSENASYFAFMPVKDAAYWRLPFAVKFTTGEYYGIVLDLMPANCTASLDFSIGKMSCNCVITQLEFYDKDMQKVVVNLNQDEELKLTFISTQRLK